MSEEPVAILGEQDDIGLSDLIQVRGARVHNLKNIDVDIPRDRLVVLTGVSGSGKSSLAFDTLFAEGQRRYVESLSSDARQFFDQIERPDADLIEGLPPTVAIDQRIASGSPRSTVATLTEIHDHLRVLYARTGIPHCPRCAAAIRRQTPEQMVASVLAMKEGRKVLLLAPLVRGRKGQHAEAFQAVRRAGLLRVRVDGEIVELGPADPKLAKTKAHDIEVVVDRLVIREGIRPRLAESLDLALKLADGCVRISAQTETGWEELALSTRFSCPSCGTGLEELEPRTFSFNSPHGACPTCSGLGTIARFDPDLVLPDRSLSLDQGAVAPWHDLTLRTKTNAEPAWVVPFLKKRDLTRNTPLGEWPEPSFEEFLAEVLRDLDGSLREAGAESSTPRKLRKGEDRGVPHQPHRIGTLDAFRVRFPCPDCAGARLRPEARAVTVGGMSLPALSAVSIVHAHAFMKELRFDPPFDQVGGPLVSAVVSRLGYLERVGLGYLTLDRGVATLSGGELQRVRLSSQVGSGLIGVCFVLDEPTAGLHPSDTEKLLTCLVELRDSGNSVVVVEHDEATIRASDWLIDLGPGAGPEGGEVVALGPPDALEIVGDSSTARYLRGETTAIRATSHRLARSPGRLAIRNARARNLRGIDVEIPLGALTCVSGVSGSGKSTLVLEILARAARRAILRRGPRALEVDAIEGLESIDALVQIDQSPIGKGPRSTPATATHVLDEVRMVYARTREAKIRGYSASRFSFNVKAGQCAVCEGQGMRRVTLAFLPDLFVRCEGCRGKRYNPQTLEVLFKGRSIGDVLGMRVDESLLFFDAQPRIRRGLAALHEAGLGYLTLGQPSNTLSGGEAQRVKLAAELNRNESGKALYILDEPTTGLHFQDVARLLDLLHRLAEQGNTVVVVEHNLDVIASSDWVVDLGPGGGEAGGSVLAIGPPETIANAPGSATGRFLRALPLPR